MPLMSLLSGGLLDASLWEIIGFVLVATHITIVAVTVYLHRCQAHRALELHPLASHFFRAWLWLTTGMVTREWAAIHRKHHARCETEDDPHSPQTRGIGKVLLEGSELYRAAALDRETIDRYGHGAPDDWIERNLYTKHASMGVFVTLGIDLVLFGLPGLTVFAIQMLWIPIFAAGVINGIGHFWGYRSWDSPDASRNIFPIGILIGGEELHNNHHTHASSAKLSSKWFEFDIGWMYIQILQSVGLAKVRKRAPVTVIGQAREIVDARTLQAVIRHRYDVIAQFSASLKGACAEESERLRAIGAGHARSIRRWLATDASRWTDEQRTKAARIFAESHSIRRIVEMREELAVIWGRSSMNQDQLIARLRAWCARADESGIRSLQDISLRVRSYAP
jgi:stearoyl-CoA desaturase (delta-9 desaturase)